jgi:putative chitinase
MKLTREILDAITENAKYASRKVALANFLNANGGDIMAPHRLACFLSQTMHESAGLRYVKELWGDTKAQKGYEGRADLGNTHKGDGKRFEGRDIIQVTGRFNYRHLTKWAQDRDPKCPDFEAKPAALEKPEYLGLGALWYWSTRVPAKYVEAGNHEMITRRINGGLNGYSDRLHWFDKSALVLLGYDADDVRGFQGKHGLDVDGVSGPATRGALFDALAAMPQETTPTAPSGLISALMAFLVALLRRKSV